MPSLNHSHDSVFLVGTPDQLVPSYKTPLFLCRIAAGFPSPADDFIESKIDLNEQLILHPEATYFLRVKGDSMIGAGIHEGDLLIVDRSLDPKSGRIVIAAFNGELTVKRLHISKSRQITLIPENETYDPIKVNEDSDFLIWGVVTRVIHDV